MINKVFSTCIKSSAPHNCQRSPDFSGVLIQCSVCSVQRSYLPNGPKPSPLLTFYLISIRGTRKAEVLNSLIMKTTANENDINDILQTFR